MSGLIVRCDADFDLLRSPDWIAAVKTEDEFMGSKLFTGVCRKKFLGFNS
jgi:hypothetical protein